MSHEADLCDAVMTQCSRRLGLARRNVSGLRSEICAAVLKAIRRDLVDIVVPL